MNETKPQPLIQGKPEKEYIKDMEIDITNIEIESAIELKVIFTTSKGRITWKPKAEITEMVRGIPVKKKIAATTDLLPEKLFKMRQELDNKGSCKVTGEYMIWRMEKDGELKEARFIMGINPLEKWVVINQEKEQQVG